jgi:serine/threonine-protein kinase
MEYFGGANLKEHLKRSGALSLLNAYQILSQMCNGLEAAHSQGVVHRDLKSQNVMVGPSGQIKIIDFGLARSVHLEGMTATGLIMGTPEYMAPEQVAGKHVDERADIYALGVILFEMLTGRVPFTGDSAIAVGFKQLKDPIHRYRTVDELRKEFESALPRFAAPSTSSQRSPERPVSQEKN